MNVDPLALAASAELADAEAQTLSADFGADDAVVASLLPGWVGQSHTAMTAAAASWRDLTVALSGRIAVHAVSLRRSGAAFAEMDARHAAALAGVVDR